MQVTSTWPWLTQDGSSQMEPLNWLLVLYLSLYMCFFAVNVILDPKTAHPKLIISKDAKQVKHSGSWRDVPNNPERFDSSACVLGKDGFSCGKIYYEVEVGEKTEWDLGMARESIERKGKVTVCPENGFWCIWLRNGGEYVANESHPSSFSERQAQKVGVFVDYEEGLVSFYNVGPRLLSTPSLVSLSPRKSIHFSALATNEEMWTQSLWLSTS